MDISVHESDENPGISILKLTGELDGSNFQQVVDAAKNAKADGATHILLDMSDVPFMGSAGLVALHTVALIMQEKPLPSEDDGWSALSKMANDIDAGMQPFVKILSPQSSVERGLKKTGMNQFIEVFSDKKSALAAFGE